MTPISGVWLPIVTPFRDGAVDFESYERLLEHYLATGVTGIVPLGTTGESPTLDDDEMEAIVDRTVSVVAGRVPVFIGIGGNATRKVLATIRRLRRYDFPGIVSVCPYYNRPGQDGLREHFTSIAEATDRRIVIYNIPYRTSVNLATDRAAEHGRRQGLVREPRAVARPAPPAPERVLGDDRRRRLVLHAAGARRRRRDPGLRASRDRTLRRHARADGGERPSRRPRDLVRARRAGVAPVQGSQPDADQARAVAPGPDRLTGVPDDGARPE
jgi:hypothetical protein